MAGAAGSGGLMSHEFVLQLLGMVACAGAVYGGIRADLRNLRERLSRLEAHVGLGEAPRRRFSDQGGA